MGWPLAYIIGVPNASSGSLSRSSHTLASPGASAGICACVLGTSPGGAQTGSESSEKPQKAGAINRDVAMRIASPVMSVRRRRDCPAARRHYTRTPKPFLNHRCGPSYRDELFEQIECQGWTAP